MLFNLPGCNALLTYKYCSKPYNWKVSAAERAVGYVPLNWLHFALVSRFQVSIVRYILPIKEYRMNITWFNVIMGNTKMITILVLQ